jgi:hypothetical protein
MSTLTAQSVKVLHLVTEIAHLVSHGHHAATHFRHGGSIGAGHTRLVGVGAPVRSNRHHFATVTPRYLADLLGGAA